MRIMESVIIILIIPKNIIIMIVITTIVDIIAGLLFLEEISEWR
jgi:hypothetical protein